MLLNLLGFWIIVGLLVMGIKINEYLQILW